ncbi:hypothetical protein [Amycolatopsis sp. PS_44_ISF1]|uniref:hypothetical protein n=1 Tax=Amycolatopsis sp. PS_44_ISF1 TaxID=2974917 RepID=UPI0028DE1DF2|nr:hypothetical protein [Amycolatopsis sp. PS_44_ISF1]MDT8915150.1 hypothetical protein [Amycolatopsis sp. PS_44_ISF1]
MPATVSDEHLTAVLRTFVRTAAPVLDAVRESGPQDMVAEVRPDRPRGLPRRLLHVVAGVRIPGTAAWARMDPPRRIRWWTGPFGRLTAAITAIPGLGGVLADRLPVQDLLGTAAQGLILCAIAGECGVTDLDTRTRLLAAVLFDRTLETTPAGVPADPAGHEVEQPSGHHRAPALARLGGALWRLGQELRGITALLGARPAGRWYHRVLGSLPVVGVIGHYLAERAGTRTLRRRALTWLTAGA